MQPDPFEEHRSLLFALAYRMVRSAMEAEDIVQEAYLRYHATPPKSIRTLKSFLTTIVYHLCIDHLKSAQAQREAYIGPWLPEPLMTGDGASLLSPLHQMTDRESISMAFLVVLESLSPLERAVFLLREVFDYPYAEIAQITGRDEAACRQLFSRANKHIRDRRPRFPASPEAHANMVGRFMEACTAGDMHGLMSLLTADVTMWSDSGGKVSGGARHPIQGRDKVARGMIGFLSRAPEGTTVEAIEANGLPADTKPSLAYNWWSLPLGRSIMQALATQTCLQHVGLGAVLAQSARCETEHLHPPKCITGSRGSPPAETALRGVAGLAFYLFSHHLLVC